MTERDRVLLRDATPDDIRALADLHVRTFRETHGPPGPPVELRERQWREKFSRPEVLLFCVVLELDGALIGFASGQPHSAEELSEYRGELNKIYLLREYHRRGLGRRLLCAAAHRFLERGIDSMVLFGDARSPTNGFYESMGGKKLLSSRGEFHGGYGWRELGYLIGGCVPDSAAGTSRELTV